MRVLLVQDNQELAETVVDVLRGEGVAVDVRGMARPPWTVPLSTATT
ncbi:MAG: hypothetical protein ACLPUO_00800 [Streptosporangiaceae bacterium]|jgi:hypothetical protein